MQQPRLAESWSIVPRLRSERHDCNIVARAVRWTVEGFLEPPNPVAGLEPEEPPGVPAQEGGAVLIGNTGVPAQFVDLLLGLQRVHLMGVVRGVGEAASQPV